MTDGETVRGLTVAAAHECRDQLGVLVLKCDVADPEECRSAIHQVEERIGPVDVLMTGGAVWVTNVIVCALIYWELDSGGPAARANASHDKPDFLFPQMTSPDLARHDWEPMFVDYLYLGFTNATAFSPTDTLPMTRWSKLTMMFQSGVSVALVALIIARSINILPN